MSFDVLGDLNWLAVIVATVAYWIIGAVWYAPPVLGRAWQRASGVVVQEGGPGAPLYIGTFLGTLLSTVATAMIAASTGSADLGDAIVLGVVLGLGFGIAFSLFGAVTETKPNVAVWASINAGYHLMGLIVVAVIVTLWD